MAFEVIEVVDDKTVKVKALNNGFISSRKGVNLPDTDVDLPALSEKDKNDLRFGVKNNVDMVFASFIRRGQDIRDIREVLGEDGKHIQIIAKIENRQGIINFKDILNETDGKCRPYPSSLSHPSARTLANHSSQVSWLPVVIWVSRFLLPRFSLRRRSSLRCVTLPASLSSALLRWFVSIKYQHALLY